MPKTMLEKTVERLNKWLERVRNKSEYHVAMGWDILDAIGDEKPPFSNIPEGIEVNDMWVLNDSKHSDLLGSKKGFFVGDICYALKDEIYDDVWGARHDYEDGQFTTDDGNQFIVAGTAWGDGEYIDNYGHLYPVDAGVIGVVPLELVKDSLFENLDCGYVCTSKEATFEAENGIFKIKLSEGRTIEINTREDEEEEDEEKEEEEEE